MKVYISSDIEGVAGITLPEEANPNHASVRYFQEQMSLEVAAACEGAVKAGAKEIVVKDAHWLGNNIDPRRLPECTRIVRGWTGHPYKMMDGLDDSFDAVGFVGYHARAGSGGNPLAHTLAGGIVNALRINGEPMSEFRLNTYTAEMLGIPVVFLSGDEALCQEVSAYNSQITTVPTMRGIGTGTISIHPHVAIKQIKSGFHEACKGNLQSRRVANPERFHIEIEYVKARVAYKNGFFPGAEMVNDNTVSLSSSNYWDILTFIRFCI